MATITVNGKPHTVQASPDTPLLYVLRNEVQLNGPKYGCGLAQCGACTVHVDGQPVRSCVTPVSAVRGPVVTIEGLGTPDKPHPLQKAFIEEQAAQCGYCTSGMIMSAAALLQGKKQVSDQEIRAALEGNLCRCGSHMRVIAAVKKAAGGVA
jgi:aerobic-type carbon monoxide dehydrogenase small subunit (CoxS/CutS family)